MKINDSGNDRNNFSIIHHNKIKELGYWSRSREKGTLLMLMITEISKLFDKDKLNKPEKLADLALRIYDYCGYYKIDLSELPEVKSCDLWSMIYCLSNELEADRVGFNLEGIHIKALLSITYAKNNNIDLDFEINRKFKMLDECLKRKY